nr:unnamed protein product [Callosobruchus analis]
MMQQNGYVSQINLPTRVEANSSTTIDHIFMKINKPKVSDSNNVNCTPFLLKNCITDHYPVLLNFSYLKKNNLLTYNNSMFLVPKKAKCQLLLLQWKNCYNSYFQFQSAFQHTYIEELPEEATVLEVDIRDQPRKIQKRGVIKKPKRTKMKLSKLRQSKRSGEEEATNGSSHRGRKARGNEKTKGYKR